MYQYYGFGLMMAQWAETCHRVFNFLILITNICCVIDKINLLYYYHLILAQTVDCMYKLYLFSSWVTIITQFQIWGSRKPQYTSNVLLLWKNTNPIILNTHCTQVSDFVMLRKITNSKGISRTPIWLRPQLTQFSVTWINKYIVIIHFNTVCNVTVCFSCILYFVFTLKLL